MMTLNSTLRRRQDRKLFRVMVLGHWTDIIADDAETDTVKWYGDGYVSASRGFTYEVITSQKDNTP